jgi:hypothetical protein
MARRELAPDLPSWAQQARPLGVNPDTMPDPPSGCVWCEWVGEVSPLENPWVEYALVTRKLTRQQEKILRAIANVRTARVDGVSWRALHDGNGLGEIPHLQGLYNGAVIWGPCPDLGKALKPNPRPGEPGSYIQAVPHATADKIKSSTVGHQFRVWWEKDGGAEVMFTLPAKTVTLGKEEFFEDLPDFRRAMGWARTVSTRVTNDPVAART